MGSAGARSSVEVSPPAGDGGRTHGDVTALLVELSRLVKARQFYPDQHPLLREIFERGFRAFESETLRGGPLEVEVRQGGFRLGGEPIGRGRVDDLAQELVTRAVKLLRFDTALTPAALERFVATLAAEREKLEQAGGFVKVLYAEPCPGVCVNEMDYGAALAQAGAPAAPSAALEAAHGDPLEFGEVVLEDDGTESLEKGSGDAIESVLSTLGNEEKPEPAAPATQLEEAPLDAESEDDRSEALVELLRELDTTTDEARYLELAREAAVRSAALCDDGRAEDGYRAILVLSAHAGDKQRSQPVRATASECLRELARGTRLDDLIERACAPGQGASLRSAQILVRLGAPIVPGLLRRVETEQDLDRRGQLFGILIAMGNATTPALCDAIRSGDRRRAGVAVRLAGEMQNAGTVPDLAGLLSHNDLDLRREAAKALVRVGSREAVEALVDALRSPTEGVPAHAAFCLGVAGGPRALEALLAVATEASGGESFELAREAVRALGRMGRPEIVPALVPILEKRSFFRRKPLRELQLAVVAAFERLSDPGALRALERASLRGDSEVRAAARQALDRLDEEAQESQPDQPVDE